jgi:CheY-like chemotaxis protein
MTTSHRPPEPAPPEARFAPAKLPPGVLAKVGETFASALSSVLAELAAASGQRRDEQAFVSVQQQLGQLQRLGMQIQSVARVLGGAGQSGAEQIDLSAALRQKLDEWAEPARRRGIHLFGPLEAFEIDVNAGVLEQLLDLAMESAIAVPGCVEIRVGVQRRSGNPMLTVEVRRELGGHAAAVSDDDFNDLHWQLFGALARARALTPQRVAVGDNVILMLEFPPPPKAHAGDAVRNPVHDYRSNTVAERRVLVVEPYEFHRVQAHRLLHDVGMKVDAVSSLDQARASLRDGVPDVLITGIPVRDALLGALLDELRAAHPRLRVIELVDDDSAFAFAFSSPGYANAARVGRQDLARTLVRAVAQELDAAWPT